MPVEFEAGQRKRLRDSVMDQVCFDGNALSWPWLEEVRRNRIGGTGSREIPWA